MIDQLGRKYLKCLRCGHKFKSKAKRPQCSLCKSRNLKEIDENEWNEGSPESPNTEPQKSEDLTKDKTGNTILETKKPQESQQKQESPKSQEENKGWKAFNTIAIIGALAVVGYIVYKKLFKRKEKQPEDLGGAATNNFGAWSNLREKSEK